MSTEGLQATKFSIVFPVICTLVGVFASSSLSWFTSYEVNLATQKSQCVQRIDSQEKVIKEKGDMFLGAMGDFLNYTTFSRSSRVEDLAQSAGPLMKAGMVITAYAPPELSYISLKITNSVRQGSLASMHRANEDDALKTVPESFGKWHNAYFDTLKALDEERMACGR